MSLQDWANNGWLQPHNPSAQEIKDLLDIVNRDLADAQSEISHDWRFGIAYNAALKLCTILLHASGYRVERTLQHYRTIQALSLILGKRWDPDVQYLETCRTKRNIIEYDFAGRVTESDADELIEFTKDLLKDVLEWLHQNHPHLCPPGTK